MRYFKLIAVSVSCAAIISGLVAWQVHRAKANHRLVDDAKASRVNAEHGDAAAELTLAHMYYYGQDVAQDYIEAARWYRKAADQGEAKGQYGLGYMYYNGQGVPHDYAEAVRWYHKAADQGDARAEVNLALTYYNGQGVSQDYAEAVRWYRKAADQGFAKAQYDLGVMYYHDQGVQQDRAEANRWLHKAANQGNENAQLTLSVGLTMWRKLFLLTQFACGVLLMVWFFRQRRSRWSPRRVDLPLTGILCLFTAGLSWYGYTHHLIWCVTCGFSAFTWFKWLLNAVLIALLVYILRPGRISPTA